MFPVWLQTHFHSSHHTLCFAEAPGVSVYFHLRLYSLSSRPLESLVATVFLLAPFACLQRGSVKLGANVMNKCRRAAGPPNLRTPPSRSLINLTDISHTAPFPVSAAVFFLLLPSSPVSLWVFILHFATVCWHLRPSRGPRVPLGSHRGTISADELIKFLKVSAKMAP